VRYDLGVNTFISKPSRFESFMRGHDYSELDSNRYASISGASRRLPGQSLRLLIDDSPTDMEVVHVMLRYPKLRGFRYAFYDAPAPDRTGLRSHYCSVTTGGTTELRRLSDKGNVHASSC